MDRRKSILINIAFFFTIFTCSLCESRNQEKRIKDLNVIRKGKRVFMLIDIRISLMLVRHRYN